MRTFLSTLALAAVLSVGALEVQADTQDPGVNARQHNQRERIEQGVRSGELTRPETRRMIKDQRQIRRLERAYKSDGELTARERARLHHKQNQASRRIHRQKHDAQTR